MNKNDKEASTYRHIILNEAEDDVSADEDSCSSNASAAVHSDWPLVMHCPQVADEANQLLWAVWHTVVRPMCEFQMMDKMNVPGLKKQVKKYSFNCSFCMWYMWDLKK